MSAAANDRLKDLQARLQAAGVTDEASLLTALEADPQLKHDLEEYQAEQVSDVLAQFAAVGSSDELVALVEQNPFLLSDDFAALIEQQIDAAEAAGDANLAAGFRERLATLQQIKAHLEAQTEQLAALLAPFASVSSSNELVALVEQNPLLLSDEFAALIEQQINAAEAAGDANLAAGLRQRLAILQQIKAQGGIPPLVRALRAFLAAADEAAARQVFEEHRALLLPYDALQMLGRFQADDAESQQRIEERRALLQSLRGGRQARPALPPRVMPVFSNTGLHAQQVTQVAGDQYNQSAHAEGGGTAIVINQNNLSDVQWQRRWTPPAPPRIPRPPVPRDDDVREVIEKLRESGRTAITSNSVAVQGMAGVGKTFLAHLLASNQRSHYADGILWEEIGSTRLSSADRGQVLNRWAAYAFDVQQKHDYQFEPGAVRVLLNDHGPLLVVFDDVWHWADIEPLIQALPPESDILITTRSHRVADDLGGDVHNLYLLTKDEARHLIALRVRSKRKLSEADCPWMDALAQSVGRHALALDIAIGSLKRRQAYEWPEAAQQIARDIREGTGFGELPLLDGEERRAEVEASLKLSYDTLPALAQERFRTLGTFAPEATFSTTAAASIWECAETDARNLLNFLTEAALLTPAEERDSWRQHSILRAYSLALLRLLDEYDATAARHAATYNQLMHEANNSQRYYELLPAYSQLRHAFSWSIENDLKRALNLIADTMNLQAAFGFVREALEWCEGALAAAQRRGDPNATAGAVGSLGNILQSVAVLPGEDRGGRLREALAAYTAALEYRRPETAPLAYAMTQNNRGNVLRDLATVGGEDRSGRLREALGAYGAALEHYRPETTPLDYAGTQNNRGTVLRELATVGEEDRSGRLRQALAACAAALEYRRPETAPLDYAMTQNNRGNVLSELATIAGEDRSGRLREALSSAWEAVRWFERLGHHYYLQIAQRTLQRLRVACGDDFEALWQSLGVGAYPAWLSAEAVQDIVREEQLINPLFAFLNTRSFEEMQQLAESYPLLRTEAVDPIFAQLLEHYADHEARIADLTGKQRLLQACREQAVAEVFGQVAQAQMAARQQQEQSDA